MNFYEGRVVPHLIDLAMRHRLATERRRAALPAAAGAVLEVGIGSGLNLAHYPAGIERLTGIDPCPVLLRKAQRRAKALRPRAELVRASAESLPFADAVFDTVVATWCLCSISEPARALAEMRRVLRPGGRLLFVEHGLAPDASVQAWQRRLNPLWRRLAGGCNLDRRTDHLIRAAGFTIETLSAGYLPGPRLLTFTYQGSALREP